MRLSVCAALLQRPHLPISSLHRKFEEKEKLQRLEDRKTVRPL